MTLNRLLSTMRALLLKYGWRKGSYGVPGGPHCMMGAALYATGEWNYDIAQTLVNAAEETGLDILGFNDNQDTALEDIIGIIDQMRVMGVTVTGI